MTAPGRTVIPGAISVDLLDELDAEAIRRGVTTEALVDELLVTTLPVVLAEAAESHLRRSLAVAQGAEKSAMNSESRPVRPAIAHTSGPHPDERQITT